MEYTRYEGFQPDYHNLVNAARNQWVDRLPLYEHIIGAKVIEDITGNRPYDLMFSKNPEESRKGFCQYWDFWRTMGYDTASFNAALLDILI